jgi:hypothetical protein
MADSSTISVNLSSATIVELDNITLIAQPAPIITIVGGDNVIFAGENNILIEGSNFGNVTSVDIGGELFTLV